MSFNNELQIVTDDVKLFLYMIQQRLEFAFYSK